MFNTFFKKSYDDLNGVEFRKNFETDSNALLIDVRTPSEYFSGTIPGAVNMDIMSYDFHDKISALDKNKTYYVFCRSGNRSAQACSIMSELGLKTYNLAGGIGAWPFN
jgi:rhodanese-related sulfurtransferase